MGETLSDSLQVLLRESAARQAGCRPGGPGGWLVGFEESVSKANEGPLWAIVGDDGGTD